MSKFVGLCDECREYFERATNHPNQSKHFCSRRCKAAWYERNGFRMRYATQLKLIQIEELERLRDEAGVDDFDFMKYIAKRIKQLKVKK
jgi:hypothetical protein